MAAILDFCHLRFSGEIEFGIFGFLDPENQGKDILQDMFHQERSKIVQNNHYRPMPSGQGVRTPPTQKKLKKVYVVVLCLKLPNPKF